MDRFQFAHSLEQLADGVEMYHVSDFVIFKASKKWHGTGKSTLMLVKISSLVLDVSSRSR